MGYIKCCVPGCKDKVSPRHRFPNPRKDMTRFKLWLDVIKNESLFLMDPLQLYEDKRVCRQHFDIHSYSAGSKRVHLNAFPTLHLPASIDEDPVQSLPIAEVANSEATFSPKLPDTLVETSTILEEDWQFVCKIEEPETFDECYMDFPSPIMTKEETEVQILQQEITSLKAELREKEKRLHELRFKNNVQNPYATELSTEEISRYSRQMLIPDVGVAGQVALKNSKVLIVGTGGLGCPAALYLAAAGVGEITLVDDDEVDLTNLHRQILHSESDVGVRKVESGFDTLTRINSNIKVIPVHLHAEGQSLLKLLKENEYSVVVDGTDNVATRYLLNDLCVLNNIPLVSGSALQMEGQLTVYNHNNGPCYRCLFPVPPPPETVTSCGDGGVLGVVPGLIGVLEALQTIKIILGTPGVLSGRLLIFDGADSTFRNVKLRNKKPNCEVCGVAPVITAPIDYEQFCGAKAHDKVENINILKTDENVNVKDFHQAFKDVDLLVDVRPPLEFQMCHLPNSLNIPYTDIQKQKDLQDLKTELMQRCSNKDSNVYVICRRGNDSQRAVHKLKDAFSDVPVKFVNVKGGLHAYSKLIDPCFPVY